MKKAATLLISVVMLGVLSGCALFLGSDEPLGQDGGNLSITFGTAGNGSAQRSITSGAALPDAVFDSLRYVLTLTGPGGETISQTVSGRENLRLTVSLGEWLIEARAYLGDVLAGSGEQTHQVAPGINAIQVPMTINGGYFAIGIQVDNGTVEAGFSAAFPDTPVTLTVTPDEGYVLKSGSLAYNDGSRDHPIEADEDGAYTFAMPAADIRVHAVFNKFLDFVIQGPQDEMVAVSVTPAAAEISWNGNETLTFSIEGYSAEAGNLKWIVNENEASGVTGNSFVVRAQDYVQRTYALTVMIKVNNQWYSGEYSFAVVE
jgi:hypothetical protein